MQRPADIGARSLEPIRRDARYAAMSHPVSVRLTWIMLHRVRTVSRLTVRRRSGALWWTLVRIVVESGEGPVPGNASAVAHGMPGQMSGGRLGDLLSDWPGDLLRPAAVHGCTKPSYGGGVSPKRAVAGK